MNWGHVTSEERPLELPETYCAGDWPKFHPGEAAAKIGSGKRGGA